MKKKILFFIVFTLIFIAILNAETILIISTDYLHVIKYNANYINRTYNMEVTKEKRVGKDLVFFGKENNTSRPIIVIVIFRGGAHVIYEDEGIKREEAISIADKEGVKVLSTLLVVWHTFREEKDIKEYLYWHIDTENQDNRLYIRFLDGEIVDKN